jgi:hypothetical protein
MIWRCTPLFCMHAADDGDGIKLMVMMMKGK